VPRREDPTICTATAPKAVFTMRTWATTAPYEAQINLIWDMVRVGPRRRGGELRVCSAMRVDRLKTEHPEGTRDFCPSDVLLGVFNEGGSAIGYCC
jgi:hypothetical protein